MSKGANVAGGLWHGVLGLFGAGSLYDPAAGANKDLTDAKNKFQNTITSGMIALAQENQTVDIDIIKDFHQNIFLVQDQAQLANQVILDRLQDTNTFVLILGLITIIVIFYLIFQKECC